MKQNLSIIGVTNKEDRFNTFTQALAATGLDNILRAQGPFTIFAPTDEAFKKLSEFNDAIKLENKDDLEDLLSYHIVQSKLMSEDLIKLNVVTTLSGKTLKVNAKDGMKINEVEIAKSDLEATNGVVHIIDSVLMPQTNLQVTAA